MCVCTVHLLVAMAGFITTDRSKVSTHTFSFGKRKILLASTRSMRSCHIIRLYVWAKQRQNDDQWHEHCRRKNEFKVDSLLHLIVHSSFFQRSTNEKTTECGTFTI